MFQTAIIKLTAVCNLDCKYCYMFNLSDKTYLRVPALMAGETAAATIDLIDRHLVLHGCSKFQIVLHGGEPTLWPTASFKSLLGRITALRDKHGNISVSLQSNGLSLSPELTRLLARHGVSVGISLDGPKAYNDEYRIDHCGRGSYDKVMGTVTALLEDRRHSQLFSGFLAVAQPDIPPPRFLDWIGGLPVRRVNVLWPIEYSHDNPPWPEGERAEYIRKPRYGHWFAALFEEWWRRDDPEIHIHHFIDILKRMAGSNFHSDAIGNDILNMFVVNTDGGIEYPDYFRAYRDGGANTPLNVIDHDLEDAMADEVFNCCFKLAHYRPAECRGCAHLHVCGGGFMPGRMETGATFPLRKSVLCHDHDYFFTRVSAFAGPHLKGSPQMATVTES